MKRVVLAAEIRHLTYVLGEGRILRERSKKGGRGGNKKMEVKTI